MREMEDEVKHQMEQMHSKDSAQRDKDAWRTGKSGLARKRAGKRRMCGTTMWWKKGGASLRPQSRPSVSGVLLAVTAAGEDWEQH